MSMSMQFLPPQSQNAGALPAIYNRPQGDCVRIDRVRSLTIPMEVEGGNFVRVFF